MTVLLIILSLMGLIWSSYHLISGATGIADHYHLSPLMIGLTIVAICSSIPELLVGVSASLNNQFNLALGNAVGSNIANIGLVLGITIIIRPLTMRSGLWRKEYPILFVIMLFTYTLMMDGYLNILDACLILLVLMLVIGYLLFIAKNTIHTAYAKEFKRFIHKRKTFKGSLLSLLFAFIVLPSCTYIFVDNLIQIGEDFKINTLLIGLTVTAIGTSLPQIITSLIAAFKGYDDIAIGNIIGSNIFALLFVMTFPSFINPEPISPNLLWRDIPIMFIITAVLLLINYLSKQRLTRWHGGLLLLIYLCYMSSLVYTSVT